MSSAVCLDLIADTREKDASPAVPLLSPRTDPRWAEFVDRHPRSSVFHSQSWLEALYQTYGYESFAWVTSSNDKLLRSGLLFCAVESWLTGRRLVSLPFSDHCEPLIGSEVDRASFARALGDELQRGRWRYIEMRPQSAFQFTTTLSQSTVPYHFHQLDLEPDLETLFRRFHKDSIQRKIRRAEREGLRYKEGSSDLLLDQFYRLFALTRSRHNVPSPQRSWFANLRTCFGNSFKIRVAYKESVPVSAMITLRHKDTLVYKYGGSDSSFSRFGGVHLLYWQSIQEAKAAGLRCFDLGRTDFGQDGLVVFKNRWGATHSILTYARISSNGSSSHSFDLPAENWKTKLARRVLAQLNPWALSLIGRALYKHVG